MKIITRLFVLFAPFCFVASSFAQFSTVWSAQYQHSSMPGFSNESKRIAEDASGNIFILSNITSDIDPFGVHGAVTYNYVTITKYSTTGALINSISIDVQKHSTTGSTIVNAFGLEVDASGNVYAGYVTWSGLSDYDVALTKYSNSLTRLWSNTYVTAGIDMGVDMKLHSSGTLFAIVQSAGGTTVNTLIKSVPSNSPAVVLQTFPTNTVLYSLALDANKAYVGGYAVKGGFQNAFVGAYLQSNGNLNWTGVYTPPGINGNDVVKKITIGIDGNIYSTGSAYMGVSAMSEVLVMRNPPNSGRFDYVRIFQNALVNDEGSQINAAETGWVYIGSVGGNLVNVYRIPSSGTYTTPAKAAFGPVPGSPFTAVNGITLSSMKISSSKNIYLTGDIRATGPSGAFISAYLEKGTVVFGNALIKVGGVPVEGDFDHNVSGQDLSLDYAKSDVYWLRNRWNDAHTEEVIELIDVSVPSPLREALAGKGNNGIILYPNPAKDVLNIRTAVNMTSVEIMDITGNRVLQSFIEAGEASIPVQSLAKGIYLCRITTGEGIEVRKFHIE